MEFKIFHNLFCATFKIQKGAFFFDEYVAKVYQRLVLELLEIRIKHWFYVAVLLFLNLIRVKLHLQWQTCHSNDSTCTHQHSILLFTTVGEHFLLFFRWSFSGHLFFFCFGLFRICIVFPDFSAVSGIKEIRVRHDGLEVAPTLCSITSSKIYVH